MAQAVYDAGSGRFLGGTVADRVTVTDLMSATNNPLEPISSALKGAYVQKSGNGLRFWDGGFFDFTNLDLYLKDGQICELVGDTVVGREGAKDDYCRIFAGKSTRPHFQFFNQAKIVCHSPIEIINKGDTAGAEPAVGAQMNFQNNNAGSRIKVHYYGPAFAKGSDYVIPSPNGFKPNGSAMCLWAVGPNVPERELLIKDGYIDWRPSGTWAAPTKGVFESKSWMKWLGSGAGYTNTTPLVFGSRDNAFVLKLGGSSSFFLNGFYSFGAQMRLVMNNLSGFSMQSQMAVYQNVQTEAHVQYELSVIDDLGAAVASAECVISHKPAKAEQNVNLAFDETAALELTADSGGIIRVGDGTGNSATNICIAAFRKWGGSANVDGAYSSLTASGTRYVDQKQVSYKVRKWGKRVLLEQIKQFGELGSAGDGRPSNDVAKLATDTNMTATNVADVVAISNNQTLYNQAYKWGFDTWDAPKVSLSGDAGAYNVVLDKTADADFAIAGDTITIKCDTFTGNLETTGEVTTKNGAVIVGGVIDKNGDSFLSFEGVDTWEVYASSADANTQTSALGSGLASSLFRFTYALDASYVLRLLAQGETLFKTVMPVEKGKTAITLNTASQIAALAARLQLIRDRGASKEDLTPLAKESTAQSARDHARAANAQTKPQEKEV